MNMPPTSHRIPSRIAAPLLPLALAGLPLSAFAQGLPTMEDPSRGQGSGILQTLQNYGYDIVLLIALLVVASMFVGVCYHAYTRYSEIHTGRATWGQFGLTVAVAQSCWWSASGCSPRPPACCEGGKRWPSLRRARTTRW